MNRGNEHQTELRGGSWNNNDNNCRVANRNNNNPDNRNNNNGFRLANAITSQPEPVNSPFTGSATPIAQFTIPIPRYLMIVFRLVALPGGISFAAGSSRTPDFLFYKSDWRFYPHA